MGYSQATGYGIDEVTLEAAAARASGRCNEEIVPIHTKLVHPKTGEEKNITIVEEFGICPETSLTTLAKLKIAFKKSGTTTDGNSSQVSDGAAAFLFMKRKLALEKKLPILGDFKSFVAVGVDPAIMDIGLVVAILAAVKAARLEISDIDLFEISDIDLFEINEAFASQFTYCVQELGLDEEKVSVNGGAIALGHPLGATGVRCVTTLLHEMKKHGKNCRFGVVTMCTGFGMDAAAMLEHGVPWIDCGMEDLLMKESNFCQRMQIKETQVLLILYILLIKSELKKFADCSILEFLFYFYQRVAVLEATKAAM